MGAARLADIIARARNLDQDAFGQIYDSYMPSVYRYVAAKISATAEVEDVTEEVFLSALRSIPSFRGQDESSLLAWLFQIARNRIADHYRARYRRPEEPLEMGNEEGSVVEIHGAEDPELDAVEDREVLQSALEQLTPEQQEVIVYKYVLQYDNQKTAGLMRRNVNAVNQLQHRALAALRRLLSREVSP